MRNLKRAPALPDNVKHNDHDSGFTLVIPTFNRPAYLKRVLSYYLDLKSDCKILVADASSDENKDKNEKIIRTFAKSNIVYLNSYKPDIPPRNKVFDALSHVTDKYALLCADDDFISPHAIEECANFLGANSDYSSAHGHYIDFSTYFNGRNSGKCFSWIPKAAYIAPSISNDEPLARIIQHLTKYVPTFYAVHRTDELRLNMKRTVEYASKYGDAYSPFDELLPSCLSIIRGKSKRMDIFYGAREHISNSAGQRFTHWREAIMLKDFSDRYSRFRGYLIDAAKDKTGGNVQSFGKSIDEAFAVFLKGRFNAESVGLHSKAAVCRKKIKEIMYRHNLLRFVIGPHLSVTRFKFTLRMFKKAISQSEDDFPVSWWLNIYKRFKDINVIKENVMRAG